MREKFNIQVPADGIGGIIFRTQYLAQRVTEDEAREHIQRLRSALDQIASRKSIGRAVPPDAPAPKNTRRQDANCSPDEKAIINLALNLSSNPKPLSLQPCFQGRSVQWISAKLQRERAARARAQGSALPSHKADGQPHSAGGNVGVVAERLADGAGEDAGNDEGSPASALQQQIKDQVALLVEKDAEIEELRRAKDAVIEQQRLADRAAKDQLAAKAEQLAAKDMVIDRLLRAQNSASVAQARPWGLTPGATPMPDTGPIKLPTKEDVMKGR